jgi:hypothetical protein
MVPVLDVTPAPKAEPVRHVRKLPERTRGEGLLRAGNGHEQLQ